MLAIKPKSANPPTITANLLPCRINHDGPISLSARLWSPSTTPADPSADNNPTEDANEKAQQPIAHFRGRRLHGRQVLVPAGYTGAVIKPTKEVPQQAPQEDEDEMEETTYVAEQEATFDKIVVWRHESVADGMEDRYVRGVEEWIGFAEAVSLLSTMITLVANVFRFMEIERDAKCIRGIVRQKSWQIYYNTTFRLLSRGTPLSYKIFEVETDFS
jgi:ribonuclease H2 subunit C